ncbi:hypothetical protein ACKVWC_005436 [Pyricularia oryzae]
MAARGNSDTGAANARPNVGDILLVIHDFQARSADELSLTKGDRVELIERDDEFGDGWFLGKHLLNGGTGLFPEVYTRPAPRGVIVPSIPLAANVSSKNVPFPTTESSISEPSRPAELDVSTKTPSPNAVTISPPTGESTPVPALMSPQAVPPPAATMPLSSFKFASAPAANSNKSLPPLGAAAGGSHISPRAASSSQESYVLSETLNVIDEHITETLRSTPSNGQPNADSGSEYSSHIDHRMSYIQGEETDEEEDGSYTRSEVMTWSADQVAEHLFTAGVEKHHCEVFRDQEITGEVLLGMDQTSIFIKAFDLGSVGRRLKTWQKIKALLDEVNGQGPTTRKTHGSDVGSDRGSRGRSRTNTITSTAPITRFPTIDSNTSSMFSGGNRRRSVTQGSQFEPVSPVSPVSPVRPNHEKRPSAASVRDLHHSRRHSSTDFRLTGTSIHTPSATPRLQNNNTYPMPETNSHRKQPSFDRNWTLGSATASTAQGAHTVGPRPLSSVGFPNDFLAVTNPHDQDSAVDLDRGYFSSTDGDGRRRNVLKKRDSVKHGRGHSRNTSYAEEQRVRSATAHSRHSHFGSMDSTARDNGTSPAAQKYYSASSGPHRRTASTNTTDSTHRPIHSVNDGLPPTVTKLDGQQPRSSPISPASTGNRQGTHGDWLSKPSFGSKNGGGFNFGLRATSEAVTGQERSKFGAGDSLKDSPMNSPARTGSSTPSAGPSFELDSPTSKSPSTSTTAPSTMTPSLAPRPKKKNKKETSAYLRGLQKITPREAMADADYSGWMKKKSSNLMTTWKPRLFVLKGRRLAYYYSEDDEQEKGLIDISFHRVLPADNERLTGLHATLTGASTTPTIPAGSQMSTIAATQAELDPTRDIPGQENQIFIFKLVPPRSGLTKAVNFTKPMVHYFAVPNIKQGRLWMAALMKATIDRDDNQPITTTYQQKTISLAKAQQMRHRPPALMNLDEKLESGDGATISDQASATTTTTATTAEGMLVNGNGVGGGLGIVFDENDSGVSGMEKMGLQKVESARSRGYPFDTRDPNMPQSA